MTRRKGAPGDLHVVEPMTPRQRLDAMLDELEPDAIRTFAYLADRLLVGQRCYGKLDLATDRRDWRKERTAEIADLLVYSGFLELKASLSAPTTQAVDLEPKPRPRATSRDEEPIPGLRFACACKPRELRDEGGIRCANCDRKLVPDF